MSVLNQSGEEQVECPLCMEPLEVDDLNFFPCTCGYQICRFCWHRIRTDENGLCPACRKAYSENPADFTPLSKEQVAQLKAEKRQRDQQRKAKLTESRKHLASVRVVQKNLVFVVGLPMRLADPEILKRHEYFGKFGKIHKVVINQSPTYAGSQGPSASAYVTYMKSDDALRAIQNVNNVTIDGRLIKSSLGTTKYCSHFMKNMPCPKPDCMYLHDFGDPEASFTKEQMHAGKHQEYEKKLHEALLSKVAAAVNVTTTEVKQTTKNKEATVQQQQQQQQLQQTAVWPQLDKEKAAEFKKVDAKTKGKTKVKSSNNSNINNNNVVSKKGEKVKSCERGCVNKTPELKNDTDEKIEDIEENMQQTAPTKINNLIDDNSSFFSQNTFHKLMIKEETDGVVVENSSDSSPNTVVGTVLSESLPDINSTEDWEAAFGFSKHSNHLEELAKQRNGFDVPKLPENILDVLSNKNNYVPFKQQQQQQEERLHGQCYMNGVTTTNFYKNGYVEHQNYLMMQQRRQQIEEQLLNLNMKHANYGTSHLLQNGVNNSQFFNFDGLYQKQTAEDELDFDPFHETQKGLAELIETEQNYKRAGVATQQQQQQQQHNGGAQIPPPPPGFLQPHMNSFGSKILPYLNMASGNQTHNHGWPNSGYNNGTLPQQQQQHKGLGTCNDWKVLDPAIVSSSRHFSLATNMPTPQFNFQQQPQQQQQQHLQNRTYDYAFSNFIQPNLNGFTHHHHQNWLGNEQISSPPGFRSSNQNTKQQEC